MAVPPSDVATDHVGLFVMVLVVSAVKGEIAQGGEVALDPVEPAGVGRHVGELDVVGLGPGPDPFVGAAGQVGLKLSSTSPMRTSGG